MTPKTQIRGHPIHYDKENKNWIYTETGQKVYNNQNIPCKTCKKQPIDDVDFCLQGLKDCKYIIAACCGHQLKPGYIKLADGRIFREEKRK